MKKFGYRWTGWNTFRIGFSYDTDHKTKALVNVALYFGWLSLYFYRPNRTLGHLTFLDYHVWRVQYYGVPDYAGFGKKFHRLDLSFGSKFKRSYPSNKVTQHANDKFREIYDRAYLLGEINALGGVLAMLVDGHDRSDDNDLTKTGLLSLVDELLEDAERQLETT